MLETTTDKDRMSKVEKTDSWIYFEKKETKTKKEKKPIIEEVIEEAVEEVVEEVAEEIDDEELSIEALRELYEEKTGKKVPNNKKNDADWIISKL